MNLNEARAREEEAWNVRKALLTEMLENLQACIDTSAQSGGAALAAMYVLSARSERLHAAYEVAQIEWHRAFRNVQDIIDGMVAV